MSKTWPIIMIYFWRDEAHFIKELVEEVSSKLESIAPSKTLEDDRSCNVGKILSFGNYGLTSVLGSVGAVLVFCLVVFPLFRAFVFIVAPYVPEGKMRVPTISFGKHYWPKLLWYIEIGLVLCVPWVAIMLELAHIMY